LAGSRIRRLGIRAHRADHRRRRPADPATQPDVEAALAEYEQAMFTRSAEDAAQTAELATTAPDEDATVNLINVYKGFDRT
jgi:hypothetical protein